MNSSLGDVIISGTQQNIKLKFSLLTYLTHINTILDDIDVLYLEDRNEHRLLLKNKTATMFFLKKTFSTFSKQFS